jgi:signal transduction histidine kinase
MVTKKSLQAKHTEASHRTAIIFPMGVAIIAAGIQMFVTKSYRSVAIVPLGLSAIVIAVIVASEFLLRHSSRKLKIIQSVGILLVTVITFGYLLPLPNPYMVLMPIFGVLLYTEYGLKIMSLVIFSLFGFLTARYFQVSSQMDIVAITNYFLTYTFIITITYYVIIYLRLSEEELAALEEASMKASTDEQQVQSLINNITDGVIAVDQHNRIVIYNAAALDVLDVNTAITNKKISSVLKPINADSQPVDIIELLKGITTPTNNRDLHLKYSDGSLANIFLGIAPIYLGYGKSKNNGYTLIMRDITREKSLEEERDEFISVVSHELRTPIAITEGSISNAQFIAEKTGDMETIRKTLKESHNQVIFLADMINDLSTLSRAERGKLEIELASINIADLIAELAVNYTPQAEVKGLVIKTDVATDIPDLQSSKLYVREILQNFITNAVKYTETGSVTIQARANPKGVDFAVIDTGIGISKTDQDKVFDKFFRSEDYRTRANNGTGLGLYVTMKLVRMIHADIDVSSELNTGSMFSIFIPNLK